MFEIYNLICFKNGVRFSFWFFDFEALMKEVDFWDYWFVEKNEIIEGLFYPLKVVARSAVYG